MTEDKNLRRDETPVEEQIRDYWGDWGISSQCAPLKSVLLRRPGSEINEFSWEEARFREGIDPDKFREAHQRLVDLYEENGVKVYFLDEQREDRPNLPARLRMAATYAVAQSMNGRVANTCNLSEDWVGYATRYGDAAGDFSPLSRLTVQEVKAVGLELGLPEKLVHKTPIDGLSGLTDEENLGFSYAVLDNYIRTGVCEDKEVKAKIDQKRRMNKFKLELMPSFQYDGPIKAAD